MNLLQLDLNKLKPYMIEAYTYVYGRQYYDVIKKRIEKALYFPYVDSEKLAHYIDELRKHKKYELALSFFQKIGWDVDKYKELNFWELCQNSDFKKIVEITLGDYQHMFEEEILKQHFVPIKHFLKESNTPISVKIPLINFLNGGSETIDIHNYFDFIETPKGKNILNIIKGYNVIYDELTKEYVKYNSDSGLLEYDKYIDEDMESKRYNGEEYYTSRKDFLRLQTEYASDMDEATIEWIIQAMKNSYICTAAKDESNDYRSLMAYCPSCYGSLDIDFIYNNINIIDRCLKGVGFELTEDYMNSSKRNRCNNTYRKYERFNVNIGNMLAIEAWKYLEKEGIELIEETKYVNSNLSNSNTRKVTMDILRPLLEMYRSVVINSKINSDRNILSSYIGKDNFEELVDVVNIVDALCDNGLEYQLANFSNNKTDGDYNYSEDVNKYYQQLERVKEIYKKISAFVSSNNEGEKTLKIIPNY